MRTDRQSGALACGPRSLVAFLVGGLVLFLAFIGESYSTLADPGAPIINTTADAVQTFYQNGVPHIDASGNVRTSYDPAQSLLPNGLYNLTPCMVSQEFSWPAFSGDEPEGWDGRYRLTVNLGSQLDLSNAGGVVSDEVVSGTAETVDLLPAATSLYYAVELAETDVRVAEGAFTSVDCPDPEYAEPVATAADAGFNFAITRTAVDTLVLADQAADSDLKLVPSLESTGYLFDTLKDDPVVFGWYLADEPLLWARLTGADPQAVYDNISLVCYVLCPQTSQVFFSTESASSYGDPFWPQFLRLGDVGVHYNYPKSGPNPLVTLKDMAHILRNQATILAGTKPSWFVVQSFGAETANTWEFPTPQEMRAMIYTAVIHGATGIIHFAWDSYVMREGKLMGLGPNPPAAPSGDRAAKSAALWEALAAPTDGINYELQVLQPVILSPTSREPYNVFVNQQPFSKAPIRTMLKEYGGSYYLLAVNIDNAPISTMFTFSLLVDDVEALFEETPTFAISGPSITDSFEPFDVHVYKLRLICPDVNGDKYITVLDIKQMANVLWSKEGDDKYQARFDVNDDGSINILDLFITWRAYGRDCS